MMQVVHVYDFSETYVHGDVVTIVENLGFELTINLEDPCMDKGFNSEQRVSAP